MADDDRAPVSLTDWLARLRAELAPEGDPRLELTPAEEKALLDLARIAAHTSERISAPLTTFLAGAAWGSLPESERGEQLRALVARLTD